MTAHNLDSDCTVDPETDTCRTCGAGHGEPCPQCDARAYHATGCPESDDFHVDLG